jgi:hypothetical protein
MDHQTTGRVEFSRAMIALEVLRFLMLQQDWRTHNKRKQRVGTDTQQAYTPFSSSNSRSQYQHHGFKTCNDADKTMMNKRCS